MTGGTVVILGGVGDNFGAGMTGGMAFVYDEGAMFEKSANPDSIIWQRLSSPHWEAELRGLIEQHAEMTNSEFAKNLLEEWDLERQNFWQVVPKEMLERLEFPLKEAG